MSLADQLADAVYTRIARAARHQLATSPGADGMGDALAALPDRHRRVIEQAFHAGAESTVAVLLREGLIDGERLVRHYVPEAGL